MQNCVATNTHVHRLTRVQALCDGGGINEVSSTQLARHMLVDITHSHCVLLRKCT